MKQIIKIVIAAAAVASLSSCAIPRPSSGAGFIYTNVKEGVSVNNNVQVSKVGQACNSNILGIVVTGNQTIDAARRSAGIVNVASVDRSYNGVLGVYAKSCTIVKGN